MSLLAVPGVPQMIKATETSRPRDNICTILVTWDPPANSDASDIAQYIVYVQSQNISSSSSSINLTLSNCGDDVRVQVAAVNHVGCVGMNSSEVQPIQLDTASESGSASTSSKHLKTIANIKLVPCLHRKSSCRF